MRARCSCGFFLLALLDARGGPSALHALPPRFGARVLGVLGVVSFGFLLFTLATSNPFLRLIPAAPDGRDLNPILQDPALAIHPPILYNGLCRVSRSLSHLPARRCSKGGSIRHGRAGRGPGRHRPGRFLQWASRSAAGGPTTSSAGVASGSGDPVENASFMPWLVGTALVHSLAVTDKRGLFKSWTLLLAILAFSLSLLGTFLVRSGVLVSVHSFAADPTRGIFILVFLIIMIGGSLTLYAWARAALALIGRF